MDSDVTIQVSSNTVGGQQRPVGDAACDTLCSRSQERNSSICTQFVIRSCRWSSATNPSSCSKLGIGVTGVPRVTPVCGEVACSLGRHLRGHCTPRTPISGNGNFHPDDFTSSSVVTAWL